MSARSDARLPRFDLLVEDAGSEGCLGHVPALPGLCFRVRTAAESEDAAPARIAEYARWLQSEDLADLTPETEALTRRARAGEPPGLRVVLTEHLAGAPVWESGNAAVLFERDRRPLDSNAVAAHLRFVGRVLRRMRETVLPLSPAERARRPAPARRSIDETLEHVGNCVWWYCSRIDDDLPEPDEPPGEDPLDRIGRLFGLAESYLPGIPFPARAVVHVPTRFPTADPDERWTHTKVCRRQAEHVWAHLSGLEAAVDAARGP